jgi:hypothetical protein
MTEYYSGPFIVAVTDLIGFFTSSMEKLLHHRDLIQRVWYRINYAKKLVAIA